MTLGDTLMPGMQIPQLVKKLETAHDTIGELRGELSSVRAEMGRGVHGHSAYEKAIDGLNERQDAHLRRLDALEEDRADAKEASVYGLALRIEALERVTGGIL